MKKLIIIASAVFLTACGGSLIAKLSGAKSGVEVNTSLIPELVDYCNIKIPIKQSTTFSSYEDLYSLSSSEEYFDPQEIYNLLVNFPGSSPWYSSLTAPHMGVTISGILGTQAVACVKPLNNWTNRVGNALPISALNGTAIVGFELSANFTTPEGKTRFGVPKTTANIGNTMSICRWEGVGKSAPWTCVKPALTEHPGFWELSTNDARPGSYVLIKD